ncbi:MAG: DUF1552 domain-containing protein [Myxococcota bacterium]
MKMKRRALLGGGAAALALPFTPAFLSRSRADGRPPRRLVFWWVPEGVVEDSWWPNAGGSSQTFSRSGLMAFRDQFSTIKGLNFESIGDEDDHLAGPLDVLSGGRRDAQTRGGVFIDEGQTIDTLLAPTLQSDAARGLYSVGVQGLLNYQTFSYDRRYRPNRPVNNPVRAFNDLVGAAVGGGDDAVQRAAERRLRLRRSVLDSTSAEIAALRCAVGAAERDQLDAQLQATREIEQRLSDAVGAVPTAPPADVIDSVPGHTGETGFFENHTNIDAVADLQVQIAAAGLIRGTTNTMNFTFSQAFCRQTYPFLSNTEVWHHDLSHSDRRDYTDMLRQVNEWHETKFAAFLDQLNVVDPLGDGSQTVLDNTLVIRFSELQNGKHGKRNLPFLLAGARGFIRQGEDLDAGGISHNRFLTSLLQSYGLDVDSIGIDRFNGSAWNGWLA